MFVIGLLLLLGGLATLVDGPSGIINNWLYEYIQGIEMFYTLKITHQVPEDTDLRYDLLMQLAPCAVYVILFILAMDFSMRRAFNRV